MKRLTAFVLAGALSAGAATAGGMSEPIEMAPVEIIEDTAGGSSNTGLIVPLILIALIAAAVAADSGDDGGNVLSDARFKDNIVPVGTAENGLPLYHFTYRGSAVVFEGVMAQDVLTHTPEAVVARPDGTLAVNYDLLGIDFKIVD